MRDRQILPVLSHICRIFKIKQINVHNRTVTDKERQTSGYQWREKKAEGGCQDSSVGSREINYYVGDKYATRIY